MTGLSRLPDLPKKRSKREANVTHAVLDWFKTHHNGSCAIEVKATDGRSIASSQLKPHQRSALTAATRSIGLVHKISDQSQGSKPFDAFMLSRVPAYVVACFTKHRICLAVPVEKWRGISIGDQFRDDVAHLIEL